MHKKFQALIHKLIPSKGITTGPQTSNMPKRPVVLRYATACHPVEIQQNVFSTRCIILLYNNSCEEMPEIASNKIDTGERCFLTS